VALARDLEPAAFALGGRVPQRALAPATLDELAAALAACDGAGEAVVIFGGGTLQGLGFPPARYDVAIATSRLDRVLAYEFRDLTISVECGLTVAGLRDALAEHGQFVPLDAPHPERGTVGGLLASGWSGPRRAAYGRPRDLVIGTSVVTADGTVTKSGGMVVKNVTGYDLSKLWCGSLGTLATIASANFKTLPLPECRRVAFAALPERTRRRAVEHIASLDIEPVVAVALQGWREAGGRDAQEGRLLLMFEGSRAVVERATRDMRSALGAAGVPETSLLDGDAADAAFDRLLDAYVARLGDRSLTYRSTGLPSDALDRCDALARAARANDLTVESIVDAAGGDVYVRASSRLTSEFPGAAERLDAWPAGVLPERTIFTAPEALRDTLAMWGASRPVLDLHRNIKRSFDPNGTMAPGRFAGRL
jgi:glycolate oxidase FAD binding subunit